MLFINQITVKSELVKRDVKLRFDNSRGDPFDFILKAICAEQNRVKLYHAFWYLVTVLACIAHLATSASCCRYLGVVYLRDMGLNITQVSVVRTYLFVRIRQVPSSDLRHARIHVLPSNQSGSDGRTGCRLFHLVSTQVRLT
jgi:hypothetical protein